MAACEISRVWFNDSSRALNIGPAGDSGRFWRFSMIFRLLWTTFQKSGIAPREVVTSKNSLRQSNGDALNFQHAYTELDS